jgi:uncharacterized protein (TIGR03084 family)
MEEAVGLLREQHEELAGLLSGLDEAGWRRPSRCEGWSIADVVLHLAQTDAMALASARGSFAEYLSEVGRSIGGSGSIDEGADRMVEQERGAPGSAVLARWQAGAAELRQALLACEPSRRVQWVAGQLSARTLATTRLAETWIHTGDVADGLGVGVSAGDRLRPIARLAWRTVPYAFTRAGRELSGPVAFELRSPSGEAWTFVPDEDPVTTIRGDALDLCLVAARRIDPADTGLQGEGPDTAAVLELVRTYA